MSSSQTYRRAANEHLTRATELFGGEHGTTYWFVVHYLCGLAVECHLRAYRRRMSDQFDSRHDLNDLAKESGFFDIVPQEQSETFSERFALLNLRWRSNHRYYSESELADYLNELKAEHNKKGDTKELRCRTVLNCAFSIITQRETKWDDWRKL